MSKLDAKRAELALLEAEEAFAAKKAAGPVSMDEKLALRALRQEYRETHRKPAEGAAPDPITSKAKVN